MGFMKKCSNLIKFDCFLDFGQEFDYAKSAIMIKSIKFMFILS